MGCVMELYSFAKMIKSRQSVRGAIVVEFAIAMIIMAAIFAYTIPLVKEMSVDALDEQAETISKHYP